MPIEMNQPSPTKLEDYPVPPKLWVIGSALSTARRDVYGFPRSISIRYLGRLARGDIVYSITSSGIDSVVARIIVADPKSGDVIGKTRVSSADIPVLLEGRGVVLLVNRMRGSVRNIDLTSGELRRYERRLPAPVIHLIPTSEEGTSAFVLTARGTLHKMDLDTGLAGPVLSSNPGSTRIALAPDGRVMLLNPFKDEFVVMDATGSRWETSVQLPGRATWLWIDPEGPFIYAGHYVDGSLNVHLIEKDTLKYREILTFPNSVSGGDAGRTPDS